MGSNSRCIAFSSHEHHTKTSDQRTSSFFKSKGLIYIQIKMAFWAKVLPHRTENIIRLIWFLSAEHAQKFLKLSNGNCKVFCFLERKINIDYLAKSSCSDTWFTAREMGVWTLLWTGAKSYPQSTQLKWAHLIRTG